MSYWNAKLPGVNTAQTATASGRASTFFTAQPMTSLPGAPLLFLLNSLEIGGSEKKIVLIANDLHSRGYNVHLLYLNGPDTLLGKLDHGIRILCLRRKRKFDIQVLMSLRRYVRDNGIKNIFCINPYPMIYGWLVKVMERTASIQCSVSINTTHIHSIKSQFKMIVYTPLLWRMDRIIFGCRYQRDMWVKTYRLDQSRCVYIYNGVDTEWFSGTAVDSNARGVKEQWGIPETEVVIGIVAQFRPEKQHTDLIEACDRLLHEGFQIHAMMVGDGREGQKLKQMVQEKNIQDHVLFVGEVLDVRPMLLAMDIFVLSSISVETFSNAALEAMAMGKPVVLSRIGGAAEMVSEGVNGYLYNCGDVTELVSALKRLVADPEHRVGMGLRARQLAETKFSFDRMVAEYERHVLPTLRPSV